MHWHELGKAQGRRISALPLICDGGDMAAQEETAILYLYLRINWTVYPSTNDGNGSDFGKPSNAFWSNSTQLEA